MRILRMKAVKGRPVSFCLLPLIHPFTPHPFTPLQPSSFRNQGATVSLTVSDRGPSLLKASTAVI